jgi:hypothetical protein
MPSNPHNNIRVSNEDQALLQAREVEKVVDAAARKTDVEDELGELQTMIYKTWSLLWSPDVDIPQSLSDQLTQLASICNTVMFKLRALVDWDLTQRKATRLVEEIRTSSDAKTMPDEWYGDKIKELNIVAECLDRVEVALDLDLAKLRTGITEPFKEMLGVRTPPMMAVFVHRHSSASPSTNTRCSQQPPSIDAFLEIENSNQVGNWGYLLRHGFKLDPMPPPRTRQGYDV